MFLAIGIGTLVVFGTAGGAVAWFVRGQNRLVQAEELCGNALSQIGVQQKSRWDSLSALAALCKAYSEQEYSTLMQTINARQGIEAKSTAELVDRQEKMIHGSMGRVNALAEAYPDLKTNTLFLKTMQEVSENEDKVRMSRMVYNDTVTKYNSLARSLPGSLLASGLGFSLKEYLEEEQGKTEMPVIDI